MTSVGGQKVYGWSTADSVVFVLYSPISALNRAGGLIFWMDRPVMVPDI
jgi:hypothetical protein